jgi:hypothetical protein
MIDIDEYIGEPCANDRHLSCHELWIVPGVPEMVVCTCDCHVTNTVVVDF